MNFTKKQLKRILKNSNINLIAIHTFDGVLDDGKGVKRRGVKKILEFVIAFFKVKISVELAFAAVDEVNYSMQKDGSLTITFPQAWINNPKFNPMIMEVIIYLLISEGNPHLQLFDFKGDNTSITSDAFVILFFEAYLSPLDYSHSSKLKQLEDKIDVIEGLFYERVVEMIDEWAMVDEEFLRKKLLIEDAVNHTVVSVKKKRDEW